MKKRQKLKFDFGFPQGIKIELTYTLSLNGEKK